MADIKTQTVVVPIRFRGDATEVKNEIDQLIAQARQLTTVTSSSGGSLISKSDIDSTIKDLQRIQDIVQRSTDIDGDGKSIINMGRFRTEIEKTNVPLNNLNTSLQRMGLGAVQVESVTDAFDRLPTSIQKSDTALDKLSRTLFNSLRYSLVNEAIDQIINVAGSTIEYLEDVDNNLNNIRIVSGRSAEEMDGFFRSAELGAQRLSTVTNDFLEASEIYYQQGLSTNEVLTRTNATIQAANISQQSVSTTASQVTAVLNGYNIAASNVVETLDKLAAVGAGTATDFEEIATASQKVASAASEAGFTLDDTLGILATISSITREAPESIGTSLNAIIGRLNNLKIGDEVTSQIEQAMEGFQTGLSIFDETTGQLKSGMQILTDVAEKWEELDRNQQAGLTSALAGTRQANRLLALFNNWDMFEAYRDMSVNAEGALEEQNKIFEQSLEAYQNRAESAADRLVGSLFNVDQLKDWYALLEDVFDIITKISDSVGGISGIITPMLAAIKGTVIRQLAPTMTNYMLDRANRQGIIGTQEQKDMAKITSDAQKLLDLNVKLISQKEREKFLTQEQNTEFKKQLDLIREAAAAQEKLQEYREIRIAGTKSMTAVEVIDLQTTINNNIKALNQEEKEHNQIEASLAKQKELQDQKLAAEKAIEQATDKTSDSYKEQEATLKRVKKELDKIKVPQGAVSTPFTGATNLTKNLIASFYSGEGGISNFYTQEQLMDAIVRSGVTTGEKRPTIRTLDGKARPLSSVMKQYGADFINQIAFTEEQMRAIFMTIAQDVNRKAVPAVSDINNAQDEVEKTGAFAKEAAGFINTLSNSIDKAKLADKITSFAIAGYSARDMLSALGDESLTTQEKLISFSTNIGAMMTAFSSVNPLIGAIGMLVTVFGGPLIQALELGISSFEKVNKEVDQLVEKTQTLTSTVNQQRQDLSSVGLIYETLAGKYQKQAFAYSDLTEEEQSQYDQVSEYVSKYAPELVRYYDETGRAIIDLTKGVGYLNEAFYENQAAAQSASAAMVSDNYDLLISQYGQTQTQLQDAIRRRQKIQEKLVSGGPSEKLSKQLTEVNEEIAEYQEILTTFGSNFNQVITDAITLSTEEFGKLDEALQNSIRYLGSYNVLINSSVDDLDEYTARVQTLTQTIASLTEEEQQNLSTLDESMRNAYFEELILANQTAEQLKQNLSTITEQQILAGDYFDAGLSEAEIEELQRRRDALEERRANSDQAVTDTNIEWSTGQMTGMAYARQEAANEYNTYVNSLSEIKDSISEIDSQLALLNNSLENSFDAEALDRYNDMLMEVASTAEGYNKILATARETQERLNTLPKGSEEYLELQQKLGVQISALMSDSEDYFMQFKANNQDQIDLLYKTYGINLNQYRTYREAQDALDEMYTNKRLLREAYLTQDLQAFNQMLLKSKIQTYADDLAALGDAEAAALFLQMNSAEDAAKQEQVIQKISDANKIQSQIDTIDRMIASVDEQIKAQKEGYATDVSNYQAQLEEKLKLTNQYISKLRDTDLPEYQQLQNLNTELTSSLSLQDMDLQSVKANLEAQKTILEGQLKDVLGDIDDIVGATGTPDQATKNIMETYFGDSIEIPFDYSNFETWLDDISERTSDSFENLAETAGEAGEALSELELDLDPLKPYIDLLDELNHQLDLLAQEKEKAYGAGYIDILQQEADINRAIIATEEAKLQKIQEITAAKRAELSLYGVTFTEFGSIANYNELLTQMTSAAGTNETAQQQVEELKSLMDEYEEYALEKTRSAETAILDAKANLADIAQEEIEYPINLIIEANDRDLELIDFIGEVQKAHGGKLAISVDVNTAGKNLETQLRSVQDLLGQLGSSGDFIDSVINNPDLEGDYAGQIEIFENQMQNLQQMGSQLVQFLEEFENAFGEALDNAVSMLDDVIGKYDNIINQYEYMISLSEQLGNQANPEYALGAYDSMADIYRNNINAYKSMADTLKESRDSFEKGTDEWREANAKYLEVQSKVIEQEKELAEIMSRRYDLIVSTGRTELENALFGGMTADEAQEALDRINKKREKYLDTEDKVYELSKLERSIQGDISEYTDNPKAQERLRKFMEKELGYLKDKEKLTQNDLTLAEKQYAILKARIEMEEAYNNRQYTQILQRRADGSYGYMYVPEISEDAADAEQAYEDAIDDLYDFANEANSELQQEAIDIRNEFLESYDTITEQLKAGTITEEEATEKLKQAYNSMFEDLKKNQEEQMEMQRQMSGAKIMQILGVSENDLGNMKDFNSMLKNSFDILDQNAELDGLEGIFGQLGINYSQTEGMTAGEQMIYLFNQLGGAGSDAGMKIQEALANAGNSTAATIMGLLTNMTSFGDMSDSMFDSMIGDSKLTFEQFLAQVTNGTITTSDLFREAFGNSFDDIEWNWGLLQDGINIDIDEFEAHFLETVEDVMGRVVAAYEEYNAILEESMEACIERQEEMKEITEELNEELSDTLANLEEEIEKVTDLTHEYAELREEVLQALEEIEEQIYDLVEAIKALAEALEALAAARSSGGGGGSLGGGGYHNTTNGPWNDPDLVGDGSGGGDGGGGDDDNDGPSSSNSGSIGGVVKPVLGVAGEIIAGTVKPALGVAGEIIASGGGNKGNSSSGVATGRPGLGGILGIGKGSSTISVEDMNNAIINSMKKKKKFHDGGIIDSSQGELYAIVQENERVLTEEQARISDRIYNNLNAISARLRTEVPITNNENNTNTNNNTYHVQAVFPNVSSAKEIEYALTSLDQKAIQYVNKK